MSTIHCSQCTSNPDIDQSPLERLSRVSEEASADRHLLLDYFHHQRLNHPSHPDNKRTSSRSYLASVVERTGNDRRYAFATYPALIPPSEMAADQRTL